MNALTLENHGDYYEKKFLYIIDNEISQYKNAWVNYISKNTNRPKNIHFRDDISERDFNTCKNLYSSMLFYCFSSQKLHDILSLERISTTTPQASGNIEKIAGYLCNCTETKVIEYVDFIVCLNLFSISVKTAFIACRESEKSISDDHKKFLTDIDRYNEQFISGDVTPYLKCENNSAIVPKFSSIAVSDWRVFMDINNEPQNHIDDLSLATNVIIEIKNLTRRFLDDVYTMYT